MCTGLFIGTLQPLTLDLWPWHWDYCGFSGTLKLVPGWGMSAGTDVHWQCLLFLVTMTFDPEIVTFTLNLLGHLLCTGNWTYSHEFRFCEWVIWTAYGGLVYLHISGIMQSWIWDLDLDTLGALPVPRYTAITLLFPDLQCDRMPSLGPSSVWVLDKSGLLGHILWPIVLFLNVLTIFVTNNWILPMQNKWSLCDSLLCSHNGRVWQANVPL